MNEKRRIVFIPGLFGSAISRSVIRDLRKEFKESEIICLEPGPVSSVHDRAVECFYQLKGGKTDYGFQHSQECNHEREGKRYPGLFKDWSESQPIDIIAYSLGAPTARYLQHLLILESFTDDKGNTIATNGDWIRSIVTIQGCNNGSHSVHVVGLGTQTLQPTRFSILWAIFMFLYVCHWVFGEYFDLNVEHWRSSRKHGTGFLEIFRKKPLINDNAGRDLSPKVMYSLNKEMSTTLPHPNTTYIACVAVASSPLKMGGGFHGPSNSMLTSFPENIIVVPLCLLLGFLGGFMHDSYGLFEFSLNQSEEDLKMKLHHHDPENHVSSDGIVSVAGQRHPYFERASLESFNSFEDISLKIQKGTWHHMLMPHGWNHMETMKYGSKQLDYLIEMIEFLQVRA